MKANLITYSMLPRYCLLAALVIMDDVELRHWLEVGPDE